MIDGLLFFEYTSPDHILCDYLSQLFWFDHLVICASASDPELQHQSVTFRWFVVY